MEKDELQKLLDSIEKLKNSEINEVLNARIEEFKRYGKGSSAEIFKELCFCILTANFSAERSIKIQLEMGDRFLTLTEARLAKELKRLGYRYPNVRAKYIVEARKYKDSIKNIINSFQTNNEMREWLIKSVKGIGYKEASHFLRNIGYTNFAIVDFHITKILARYDLIEKPKTLTKRKYLEIEELMREIAGRSSLNLAELDLYLWYMDTGKILK